MKTFIRACLLTLTALLLLACATSCIQIIDNGPDSSTAATDAPTEAPSEPVTAILTDSFPAVSGVRYVAYACVTPRAVNGHYIMRMTEFDVLCAPDAD